MQGVDILQYTGGPFDVHADHDEHEPHVPVGVTMALLALVVPLTCMHEHDEHEPHVPVSESDNGTANLPWRAL